MSKRKSFNPSETVKMERVMDKDLSYGMGILKAYENVMSEIIGQLFVSGATGLVLGDDKPKTFEFMHRLFASGNYSRPEDQFTNSKIPKAISSGAYVAAKASKKDFPKTLRHFTDIRFQGCLEDLCAEDTEDNEKPKEGTGTVIVALLAALAKEGILPRVKQKDIFVRDIKIASMFPDDDHVLPWIAVEIDVSYAMRSKSVINLPRTKDGLVPLVYLKDED